MRESPRISEDLKDIIEILSKKIKDSERHEEALGYANAAYLLTKIWAAFLAVEQSIALNRSYPATKPGKVKDEKAN
jgi:hypothetical protein